MATPARTTELEGQVADLRRTVEALTAQTPEGQAATAAAVEHTRLVALAEAGRADAVTAASAATAKLTGLRERGARAKAGLGARGQAEVLAFDTLGPTLAAQVRGLVRRWDGLREALDAPDVGPRLAGLAGKLREARVELSTLPRALTDFGRLVVDMERLAALAEG